MEVLKLDCNNLIVLKLNLRAQNTLNQRLQSKCMQVTKGATSNIRKQTSFVFVTRRRHGEGERDQLHKLPLPSSTSSYECKGDSA